MSSNFDRLFTEVSEEEDDQTPLPDTQGSNFDELFAAIEKETPEDKLKRSLRKPGAFVKGTAKGIAAAPRIAQAAPVALASALFRDAPFAPQINKLLSELVEARTPAEEAVSKRLESKFVTAPEERTFEEAGQKFGENIGLGISPIGAGIGATASQVGKALGIGEVGQTLLELGGLGIGDVLEGFLSKASKGLGKKAFAREALKTEAGLPKFKEPKTKGLVKPLITPSRQKKVLENVLEKAEKQFELISEKKLPAKAAELKGIDIDSIAEEMFKAVQEGGKEIKGPIASKGVAGDLIKESNKLKTGIEPTIENASAIIQLNRNTKNLLKSENQTVSKLLEQYRNNNANIKRLYKKFDKTPAEFGRMKAAAIYNDVLANTMKTKVNNKTFNFLFDKSNIMWKESKKLKDFNILSEKFIIDGKLNPTKFNGFMQNNNNFKKMSRLVGADGAKDLKVLASDFAKINKDIRKIEVIGLPTIVKKALLKFIPGIGLPIAVGKTAVDLSLGYIYTSPQRTKIFGDFIKSISTGNVSKAKALVPQVEKMINNANKNKDFFEEFDFKVD